MWKKAIRSSPGIPRRAIAGINRSEKREGIPSVLPPGMAHLPAGNDDRIHFFYHLLLKTDKTTDKIETIIE